MRRAWRVSSLWPTDYGDVFALDDGFDRHHQVRRAHRQFRCAARRVSSFLPNFFFSSTSSASICCQRNSSFFSSFFSSGLFCRQFFLLALDLHFLELAQRPQTHVQNRFGLIVGQLERFHQNRLWLVLGADDLDDFVEIEIGDQVAGQNLQPRFDLRQLVMSNGGSAHPGGERARRATLRANPSPAARYPCRARSCSAARAFPDRVAGTPIPSARQDRHCAIFGVRTTRTSSALSSCTSSSNGILRACSNSAIFSIRRDFCT